MITYVAFLVLILAIIISAQYLRDTYINTIESVYKPMVEEVVVHYNPPEPTVQRTGNMWIPKEEKHAYFRTVQWYYLRLAVFNRDGDKCVTCGSTQALRCHHITYINFTDEQLSDLATLCDTCHNALHKELGYDRRTTYNPKVIK